MAKFTKLNIGEAVASSGGRVLKKLSVKPPIDYNTLVGTWKFNTTVSSLTNFGVDLSSPAWGLIYSTQYLASSNFGHAFILNLPGYSTEYGTFHHKPYSQYFGIYGYYGNFARAYNDGTAGQLSYSNLSGSTIEFTELINDPRITVTNTFKSWLQANATKIA